MKKRGSSNFCKSGPPDAEARARLRHKDLLRDYLDLQKDFVFKKKKLQEAKQRSQTLEAEVRFLRRRHCHLLKLQTHRTEAGRVLGVENTDTEDAKVGQKRRAALEDSLLVLNSTAELDIHMQDVQGTEEIDQKQSSEEDKFKSCLITGKRVGEKKISWRDPLARLL